METDDDNATRRENFSLVQNILFIGYTNVILDMTRLFDVPSSTILRNKKNKKLMSCYENTDLFATEHKSL